MENLQGKTMINGALEFFSILLFQIDTNIKDGKENVSISVSYKDTIEKIVSELKEQLQGYDKDWYKVEDAFPVQCLCKFKPTDKEYVVDTITQFIPNDGWYEFIGFKGSSYCIAIPIKQIEQKIFQLPKKG